MTEEILGIEEEDSLAGKLKAGKLDIKIGYPFQILDLIEDTEVTGFITAINTHKLILSVENPDNLPLDESREFLYGTKIKYDLRYFTNHKILEKNMEESELIDNLKANFGDLIQFSNTKKNPKLTGYFISKENGSFKISIENPNKPAFKKSRDLLLLPNFKYGSEYFKYGKILNGNEKKEEDIKKELDILSFVEFN